MLSILYVFLMVTVLAATIPTGNLQFRADGSFSILQITDLHYGESDEYDEEDTAIQRKLMDYVHPDFLAYTGDMVAGYSWNKTSGWYKAMWNKWTCALSEKKIPYGYTLGNHDSEADLSRKEIVELDMQHPLSYTSLSPKGAEGASNFVVPVFSSKNPKAIVLLLWFFDSGDYKCLGVDGYGCVDMSAVKWYMDVSAGMEEKEGRKIPGVAFLHIPPPEFMYAYDHYPGVGNKTEDICCSSMNTGLIAAMKKRGDIIGVYAGHDHSNDHVNVFEGIQLGYGRKTGYGSYGPPEGMQRGGRVLVFKEGEAVTMETYIIQEDGTKEIQKEISDLRPIQDVCGGSKPPIKVWLVC